MILHHAAAVFVCPWLRHHKDTVSNGHPTVLDGQFKALGQGIVPSIGRYYRQMPDTTVFHVKVCYFWDGFLKCLLS